MSDGLILTTTRSPSATRHIIGRVAFDLILLAVTVYYALQADQSWSRWAGFGFAGVMVISVLIRVLMLINSRVPLRVYRDRIVTASPFGPITTPGSAILRIVPHPRKGWPVLEIKLEGLDGIRRLSAPLRMCNEPWFVIEAALLEMMSASQTSSPK